MHDCRAATINSKRKYRISTDNNRKKKNKNPVSMCVQTDGIRLVILFVILMLFVIFFFLFLLDFFLIFFSFSCINSGMQQNYRKFSNIIYSKYFNLQRDDLIKVVARVPHLASPRHTFSVKEFLSQSVEHFSGNFMIIWSKLSMAQFSYSSAAAVTATAIDRCSRESII